LILDHPFETALKRAQITDFRWHDLRHCCASYLAMNGASLAEIAEFWGIKHCKWLNDMLTYLMLIQARLWLE